MNISHEELYESISSAIKSTPELTDNSKYSCPIVITNDKLINTLVNIFSNDTNSEYIDRVFTSTNIEDIPYFTHADYLRETSYFIKLLEVSCREAKNIEDYDLNTPLRHKYMHFTVMHMDCLRKYNGNLSPILERFSNANKRENFDSIVKLSLHTMHDIYNNPNTNEYEKHMLEGMMDVYSRYYAPAIPLYKNAGKNYEKMQNDFYSTFQSNLDKNRENGSKKQAPASNPVEMPNPIVNDRNTGR